MNRHQLREMAMTCLYQSFLLKKDIKSVVFENMKEKNQVDPFLYAITIDACENINYYVDKINSVLKDDWEFNRLGYVEQAILIMAASELTFETAQKPIVIDEAITLAKKYCDDETYKLINGVLDRL
ncbi:MAG: transcription antitermination factor NusB [Bacilli bacterium]|nr:transcription antitermination factor NusB [Bacilli bacterium]